MRGEIAEQYPGGDGRRENDIEAGAARPARLIRARWRETEIHHVDLNSGYAHGDWPAEFVDLLPP